MKNYIRNVNAAPVVMAQRKLELLTGSKPTLWERIVSAWREALMA